MQLVGAVGRTREPVVVMAGANAKIMVEAIKDAQWI